MKKILFLSFGLVVVLGLPLIALCQQFSTAPAVRVQPVAPAQPIRIEVGQGIAKSVEITKVPGNEIKIISPQATVIHTPPPVKIEHRSEGHHVEVSPTPKSKP